MKKSNENINGIFIDKIMDIAREIVQTQVPCGFEPNGSFFVIWVQTQRSVFRSSGFEPRGSKN